MMRTIPLGELIAIRGGGTPSRTVPEYWSGDIRWATVKDFKSTELSETEESITQEGIRQSATNVIPAGSVIVPTRMAVGKAAINTIDLAINQDLKALMPNSKLSPDFLAWLLRGTSAETLARTDEAAHGTKVLRIERWTLMPVPIPPLAEQSKIIAGLMEQLGRLDILTTEAQRAIDLLQERRTAFISAAVTGQIDVRHQ